MPAWLDTLEGGVSHPQESEHQAHTERSRELGQRSIPVYWGINVFIHSKHWVALQKSVGSWGLTQRKYSQPTVVKLKEPDSPRSRVYLRSYLFSEINST